MTESILTRTAEGRRILRGLNVDVARTAAGARRIEYSHESLLRALDAPEFKAFSQRLSGRLTTAERLFRKALYDGHANPHLVLRGLAREHLALERLAGDGARRLRFVEPRPDQQRILRDLFLGLDETLPSADQVVQTLAAGGGEGLRAGGLSLYGLVAREFQAAGIDLRFAVIDGAYLEGGAMTGARLSNARLRGVVAIDVDLSRATLTEADLMGFHARRLKVTDADFRHADLRRAQLTEIIGWESAQWRGAIIDGVTRLPFSLDRAREMGMIVTH